MRRSLALPILCAFILVAFGALIAGYSINRSSLHQSMENKERDRIHGIAMIVKNVIEDRLHHLSLLPRYIQGSPDLSAALERYLNHPEDPAPLIGAINNLYIGLHLDICQVINRDGVVIYRAHAPQQRGDAADIWGLEEALAGESTVVGHKQTDTFAVLSLIPIRSGADVLGVIALGMEINNNFAAQIAASTQTEIGLVTLTDVLASSARRQELPLFDRAAMERSLTEKIPIYSPSFIDNPAVHTLAIYYPIKMVDETLHLIVRSDVSASIKLLKSSEASLMFLFCAALLLISLLSIPVSLQLVRPLRRLHEKVEAFIETIVGRRVQFDKGNEIDRLTAAWDIMTQTLQQHLREIDRSRKRAEKANRTKSEFLANMSHELRTPLNHIIGFTELVLSRSFGDLTAEQEEFLKDVLASSRHLLSLINDVLDLSKVEAGKMALELSEVRIRELLENSLAMVKEKALKNQLRLAVELDGVSELLQIDERKIKQVVYNLLSNAVKFTPAGGEVRLGAGIQEAAQLSGCPISTEGHAKWLSVWVADTGIGLEAKDLERIFHPFEQVEGSASRKFQGTGLGLSLTRKMVELHSGAIWAESRGCGKGSAFRFVVPARAVQS